MIKQNIGIIYGGKSAEHSVSLLTAKSIINAINKEKYNVFPIFISLNGEWARGEQITSEIKDQKELIFSNFDNDISGLLFEDNRKFDIVFPVLHGPNGEDGTIQGLLEIMDIAYVGNNVLSSAAGMDKVIMKQLFAAYDLPQLPYTHFIEYNWKKNKNKIIKEKACWGIGIVSHTLIDEINILEASLLAMKKAYEALSEKFDVWLKASALSGRTICAVADGTFCPDIGCECRSEVKADAKYAPVMAASILAKTYRDAIMIEMDKKYPAYGYARHKGYPTAEHRRICREIGPSPIQRLTFHY